MKVYVYLYENGEPVSVEDLSGPEGDAIEKSLGKYGTLNVYTKEDYAVIENLNEKKFNEKHKLNKPFVIKPGQPRGSKKWGEVKVEFRTTELDSDMEVQEAGRRKTRKSKRRARKTRRRHK